MNPTKYDVEPNHWETIRSYVATYPDGDKVGACDVRVQIGKVEEEGVVYWFVRTHELGGGPDEGSSDSCASREEAECDAHELADCQDEAEPGEDAKAYLVRRKAEDSE